MSILESLFQQYLYIAEQVLCKSHEEALVKDLLSFIDKEFHDLLNSDATMNIIPKEINQKMHVVTPCFVIAVYRGLKDKVSRSISIDQLNEILMAIFRELVGSLAEMQRNQIENASDKWKSFKEATIFGTENTYSSFEPEFIQNDEKVLKFHLNKCIFFEVFKVHDEQSIASILCNYDQIFAEAVEEWIFFTRPKIIADGDDLCEFCYEYKAENNKLN
jgi:hypothetical protein